jgi:hypothetical protein
MESSKNGSTGILQIICGIFRTLSQLRLEILTGLSFGDLMLKPLWIFVNRDVSFCSTL